MVNCRSANIVLFSGNYDPPSNVSSRLEQLAVFEHLLAHGAATSQKKTLDDFAELLCRVVLLKAQRSTFQGIDIGGGYVLTVCHGVVGEGKYRTVKDTQTNKEIKIVEPEIFSGFVGYKPNNLELTNVSVSPSDAGTIRRFDAGQYGFVPIQTIVTHSSFLMLDVALLYTGGGRTDTLPLRTLPFPPGETLNSGEEVYLLAFDPLHDYDRLNVVKGRTVGFRYGRIGSNKMASFEVATPKIIRSGYSGSPVFDAYGNLIGLSNGSSGKELRVEAIGHIDMLLLGEKVSLSRHIGVAQPL